MLLFFVDANSGRLLSGDGACPGLYVFLVIDELSEGHTV